MRKLLWMVVVAVLVAAGCGDDGGSETSPSSGGDSGGTATTGGSLTIADKSEVASLDPIRLTGSSSAGANQAFAIYDALMRIDPETGQVVGQLAEGVESEDGVDWTLRLRDGVQFSDGTPLDAEAVKFNWQRHMDEALSSVNRSAASQIETLTVVSPTELQIHLEAPNAAFSALLVDRLAFIGSPTAIESMGESFGREPVGAGPFVLREWIADSEMTLDRNADYWNAPLPNLDELRFRVIVDGSQRSDALKGGEIDIDRTTALPDVGKAQDNGQPVVAQYTNLGTGILLNNRTAPFDDPELRRAMTLAIDRAELNTVVNAGAGEVMTGLFAEGSVWRADDVALPDVDKDEAQRIFEAYEADNGSPLSFGLTVFQNPESTLLGEYIQSVLGEYGVEVAVEAGENSAVVGSIIAGEFTAAHWSFPVGPDPEPLVYDSFYSSSAGNRVGYSNPAVDEALDEGRASIDFDTRYAAYKRVQEHLIEDAPVVWVFHQVTGYITATGVQDLALSGDGIVLSDRLAIAR